MMEPFQLELLTHRLIEIGTRIQASAFAIAEHMGHPSAEELADTCYRAAREATLLLDRFQSKLAPKRSLPWP